MPTMKEVLLTVYGKDWKNSICCDPEKASYSLDQYRLYLEAKQKEHKIKSIPVHKGHCCKVHGCKYGEEDCPVVLGKVKQTHPCMDCDTETRRRI